MPIFEAIISSAGNAAPLAPRRDISIVFNPRLLRQQGHGYVLNSAPIKNAADLEKAIKALITDLEAVKKAALDLLAQNSP
jgi:hypothetical protein